MKWRLLIGAVALAAAGWAGWWFLGAAAHEAAIEAWLAERRAAGWQADYAELTTRGFPNRFDTRIEEVRIADPEIGWAWRAPFVDILMLSYAPNRAVLALPPEQSVAAPGAEAVLRSDRMRASVRFAPDPRLPLSRLSVEIDRAALAAEAGWTASAATFAAHLREAAPGTAPEHGYDLYLEAEEVRPPDMLLDAIDPGAGLPAVFDRLVIDGRAALDRPLDRRAVEEAPPQIRALSLTRVEARWGEMALSASGRLAADAEGYAEGRLELRAENWREMLRAGVAAGAIDRNLAGALEAGLGFVAGFGGDADVLEAPLIFSGGRARIGPVPVGRAPRLMARPPGA